MRHLILKQFLLLCMACSLAACSPSATLENAKRGSSNHGAPHDTTVVEFDPERSLHRINAVRQRHFVQGLRKDPRLMAAARNHAEYMGRSGKFGHEFGPETRFQKRIFATGFTNSAGENIGVGYRSVEEAIDGWMNSPGHRKIMLKRNYSLGGIAYARNVSGRNPQYNHFWVLILGKE